MAKHIAPPATFEQISQSLGLAPEEMEYLDRVIDEVLQEEASVEARGPLAEPESMAKHIAPPATAEQIMQALGVTQEDREIIDRVLREIEEEEEAKASRSSVQSPIQRPDPENGSLSPKTGPKGP